MRRWRLIVIVAAILLLASSVSVTGRYTLEIVDPDGRPQTAYAIYRHQGSRWNPVHPVSYDATPSTPIRGDSAGRLTIPFAVHLRQPFPFQTRPALWLDMIYVPRLHNAAGRIGGGQAVSTAGSWEMDTSRQRAVAFDLSDTPERWQGTLANLSFFIRPLVSPPRRHPDVASTAVLQELIAHFRAEYEAFLTRWGDAARPRPPMPAFLNEEEKRRWIETVDADLARRPTWGMEIRRLHQNELAMLEDVEAGLGK